MGPRATWLLFALATLLTAWILVFERGGAKWEGAGRAFPDLEPEDIVRLEIVQPGAVEGSMQEIVLARRADDWWIESPVKFRGFLPRIQGLLWAFVDTVLVGELTEEEAARVDAVPGAAATKIRAETRQGRSHRLELGKKHVAIETDLYARLDGRLVVTRAELAAAFRVGLEELRSRAIVPIAALDAIRVEVSGDARLEKALVRPQPGEPWRFVAPEILRGTLADRERVDDMLGELNAWQVESFHDGFRDDPGLLERSGLASPRHRLLVEHRRGEVISLDVGASFEEAGVKKVWLTHRNSTTALVASATENAYLELEAERLRTRYALELPPGEIVRVDCRAPGRPAFVLLRDLGDAKPGSVELDDAVWRLEEGDRRLVADRLLVTEAIAESRQLLIEEFLESRSEGEKPPALSEALAEIEFHAIDGSTALLRFESRSDDERDRGLSLYNASRGDDRSRFRVISRWPARVALGAWVFADREISRLDPAQCLEIRIQSGDSSWVIGRPPGSYWTLASGGGTLTREARLDDQIVERLLVALRRERFRLRSFEPTIEPERYEALGIGTHRFFQRFEITGATDRLEGFRRLTIGYRETDDRGEVFHPARVDGVDVVVTLDPDVPQLLERLVEHLRSVVTTSSDE